MYKNTPGREQIENILDFLPKFKNKNFFPLKPGCEDPYILCYSEEVDRFYKSLSQNHFFIRFEWVKWQKEALKYINNPDLLQNADIETICKLFTLHFRKERFCEGHLKNVFQNGHITALLERLSQIKNTL